MEKDPYSYFTKCYKKEVEELQANLDRVDPEAVRQAVDLILNCKGKLILSGIGKSGLIAQKLAATFSSTGTPAFFLHPGEALHGDLGAVEKRDVMMVLGKSGESDEMVQMLAVVKKINLPVIGLVGNAKSSMARMSQVVIDASVLSEADSLNLAPTASTTVALVLGDALATALAEMRDFKPENFAFFHPGGQLGKRLLLNVDDVLIQDNGIPVVNTSADMKELLEVESKPNLGGVMVVDENEKLVGLVTDGDIRRAITEKGNVLECAIVDIMTRDPITVQKGSPAIDALRLMEDRPSQINVMPVVDEGKKPVGLLRLHDLVRAGL